MIEDFVVLVLCAYGLYSRAKVTPNGIPWPVMTIGAIGVVALVGIAVRVMY